MLYRKKQPIWALMAATILFTSTIFVSCATTAAGGGANSAESNSGTPGTPASEQQADAIVLFVEPVLPESTDEPALAEVQEITVEPLSEQPIRLIESTNRSKERVILTLGNYEDTSFLRSFVDTFMRETYQFPFPPIVGFHLERAYIHYLTGEDREFILDSSLSNWTLRAVFKAITQEMESPYGIPYFQLEGSAIILIQGGVVIVPVHYMNNPNYTPMQLETLAEIPCYINVSGSNAYYPLPRPIQRSLEMDLQLQRAGRDRYHLVGNVDFDSAAGARAASTSIRLKVARDYSADLAANVQPDEETLGVLIKDLRQDEAIDILYYLASGEIKE